MTHQHATIEDTVYFWFAANDTSGSGGDGSTPLYDVREAGAASSAIPLLSGTPTLLSHANYPAGCHEVAVAATTGNGFAADDTFAVFCTLLIDSQNPSGFVGSCTLGAIPADMTKVSGDATAADNLEATYDGTGYADDQAPSTQSQIAGIANVGSAVHRPAASYTLTTGTQSANTVASTEALDGTRHEHTDAAGVLLIEYHFLIGAGTPSSVQITGYVTGSNDDVDIYGYDWVAAAYVQIGNISGSSSTSNSVYSFDLFVDMVGSGTDLGKVDIKIAKASGLSSATLAIDQTFVAFSQGVSGYENASVWYDDDITNTNTVAGVDGTAGNPVSTEAAVETLLTSTGLHRVQIAPGSTYTLATTHNNRLVMGHGGILALGGQDVDDTHFFDMHVSGTGTAATEMEFHDCDVSTASVQKASFHTCTFLGTVTMTLAGDYFYIDSQSGVAGAGAPVFTKTAGQTITAQWRKWSNGITVSGIESGDVMTISGTLGTVTLNGADGTVEVRGTYKSIVDNRTGSPSLNTDGAIKGVDVATILADTADMQPKLGTPTDTDLATDIANVQTAADAIPTTAMRGTDSALLAASINLTGGAVDTVTTLTNKANFTLSAAGNQAILDADLTEGYSTGVLTLAKAQYEITQTIGESSIVSTTRTTKKRDTSTTALTATLNNSTAPTSITRAT